MPNTLPWRNTSETCAFPFREGVTLQSESGGSIPEGLLVDAQVFVPQQLDDAPHIGVITMVGSRLLGDVYVGETLLASFSVEAAEINNAQVQLEDSNGISRGILLFGSQAIAAFRYLKLGQNLFTAADAGLESSCVFRFPSGVLNEIVVDDTHISGKVALVEGDGIELKVSGNTVRVDAVGSPSAIAACCESDADSIRFINNAVPDPFGDITFNLESFSEPTSPTDPRQILRIRPIENGIEFSLSV